MKIKNPTLRRRTKELTECANDARECQLLGYELKELGSLVASMAIHMGDLQSKIDSQAEHIKALNEKLTNSEFPNNCETCRNKGFEGCEQPCLGCGCCGLYEPKDEPQTYVINPQEPTNDDKCFECDDFFTCDGQCDEVKTEPQTDRE